MKNFIKWILVSNLCIASAYAQKTTFWTGTYAGEFHTSSEYLLTKRDLNSFLDQEVRKVFRLDSKSKEAKKYRSDLKKKLNFAFNFPELAVDLNLTKEMYFLGLAKYITNAFASIVADGGKGDDLSEAHHYEKALIIGTDLLQLNTFDIDYGVPAIFCHELGHHESKIRVSKSKYFNLEFAVEGSSDEYAAKDCLPHVLKPKIKYDNLTDDDRYMLGLCQDNYEETKSVEMCLAIAFAGKKVAEFRGLISSEKKPFENSLMKMKDHVEYKDSHYGGECTIAVFSSAALCLEGTKNSSANCKSHSCWFGK